MDPVMIHRLEISVVRRPEDWVDYVSPDDLGYSLRYPLLDTYCREAEDVLPIGFVLRVAIVVNLWLDSAVVGADPFGGRSGRRKHVSLLDVDGRLVVFERVVEVARQSLHSVGGVFEQLPLKDALHLYDECICVVVGVGSGFVFVEEDILHLHQDLGSCLRADAEECASVYGKM